MFSLQRLFGKDDQFLRLLEKIKGQNDILQGIEAEADDLMLSKLKDLYANHHDALQVTILKDLYEVLEQVVDRCRDTGNVISNIILKNS